jgi:nitronate monooxygenase
VAAWPDRRFLTLTGAPVVQAPMAGSGGVDMAIGAIRGGGVGSLPCAMLAPAVIAEQVAAVRLVVSGPVNLNFFCHTLPETVVDRAWLAGVNVSMELERWRCLRLFALRCSATIMSG